MTRPTLDLDFVRQRAEEIYGRLVDRTPFFGIYIDCAGLAGAYCGADFEEALGV